MTERGAVAGHRYGPWERQGRDGSLPRSGRAVVRPIPTSLDSGQHSTARAGIGGGIRLQEALADAESQLPKLVERPISLTAQRIARGLACCVLIGLLAVAHIQLRFMINDSRLQHQRMQRIHTELVQNYALLERSNAQLSDYDRLHAYATQQMHMVEVDSRPVAYITTDVRQKYDAKDILLARHGSTPTRAIADAVKSVTGGSSLLKLVDTGRSALAGQLHQAQ